MKTYRLFIIFIAAFILPGALCAQTVVKDAISVNGLKIGERYTQQQFMEALGTPTKVDTPSATDEYQNAYTYYFGKDQFYLIDGVFYGFQLDTPAFFVNGLIRLEDNISKIKLLEGIQEAFKVDDVQLIYWQPSKIPFYDYTPMRFYYNEENVITCIMVLINDL